ncbi:MAG: hypothetical protein WBM00_00835, partial [Solirubrobacterales bacterium]
PAYNIVFGLPGAGVADYPGRRDVMVGRDDAEVLLVVATEQFGLLRGEGPPVDAGRRARSRRGSPTSVAFWT